MSAVLEEPVLIPLPPQSPSSAETILAEKEFEAIRKVCCLVIQHAIPILHELKDDDNDMVDDVIDALTPISEDEGEFRVPSSKTVLAKLQNMVFDLIEDANTILTCVAKIPTHQLVLDEFRACPLIRDSWTGDAFDKSGVDGLHELYIFLEGHRKSLTPKRLVVAIVDSYAI